MFFQQGTTSGEHCYVKDPQADSNFTARLPAIFQQAPTAAMMAASKDDGFAPVIDHKTPLLSTPTLVCPPPPKTNKTAPFQPRACPALVDHPIGLLQISDEELNYLIQTKNELTVIPSEVGDDVNMIEAMDTLVNFDAYGDLDALLSDIDDSFNLSQ